MSQRLGGRSEVLKAKFIELLKYMELEKEMDEAMVKKDEVDRYLSFLSMLHSNSMSDNNARKKFMESIKPNIETSQEIPQYETDIELLKRMKAMQKGG